MRCRGENRGLASSLRRIVLPAAARQLLLPPLFPALGLRRGESVFEAGDVDDHFYVLLKGEVLITHEYTSRARRGFDARGRPARGGGGDGDARPRVLGDRADADRKLAPLSRRIVERAPRDFSAIRARDRRERDVERERRA